MKLAIAPINWSNDDMPDLGGHIPFEQCISEMALAGYEGCEIGNKYPKDAAELSKALELRNLKICNQWFTYTLTTNSFSAVRKSFEQQLNFLEAMGANIIGGCECGRKNFEQGVLDPHHKIIFTAEEWKNLTKGLNELGKIAIGRGFKLAYHHHMGTGTENMKETDRLLENTHPDWVFLNYDCGHFAFAGENPVAALNKYISRVAHVHLKDVRQEVLEKVNIQKWNFLKAVREGVFNVPGDEGGIVNFPKIFKILKQHNYKDWIVVEAEQDPSKANPLEYAKRAKAYLDWQLSFV